MSIIFILCHILFPALLISVAGVLGVLGVRETKKGGTK